MFLILPWPQTEAFTWMNMPWSLCLGIPILSLSWSFILSKSVKTLVWDTLGCILGAHLVGMKHSEVLIWCNFGMRLKLIWCYCTCSPFPNKFFLKKLYLWIVLYLNSLCLTKLLLAWLDACLQHFWHDACEFRFWWCTCIPFVNKVPI